MCGQPCENLSEEGGRRVLSPWAGVLLFLVGGLLFALGGLVTGLVLGWPRSRRNWVKNDIWECGNVTQGPTWVRFRASFFLYALVFLIFDIETIYLYPWAVKFQALGLFAFVEMMIFIAILVFGLWYAWREGALEWK